MYIIYIILRRYYCTDKKEEIKKVDVVEAEGNIIHATGLLGEAVNKDQNEKTGGNTTIHHQHVIYKNKESKVRLNYVPILPFLML